MRVGGEQSDGVGMDRRRNSMQSGRVALLVAPGLLDLSAMAGGEPALSLEGVNGMLAGLAVRT